mmetsp:Transcript_23496/g.69818  ORF Transcript_23496/g.69818 Transcript_23496/m.69818 type:complete len:216 (+) Transcript_23496:600-1247(+)
MWPWRSHCSCRCELRSTAVHVITPSWSMCRHTSILQLPAGPGGSPAMSNCPITLQREASLKSPSITSSEMSVWLSCTVVKTWRPIAGTGALAGTSTYARSPAICRPNAGRRGGSCHPLNISALVVVPSNGMAGRIGGGGPPRRLLGSTAQARYASIVVVVPSNLAPVAAIAGGARRSRGRMGYGRNVSPYVVPPSNGSTSRGACGARGARASSSC